MVSYRFGLLSPTNNANNTKSWFASPPWPSELLVNAARAAFLQRSREPSEIVFGNVGIVQRAGGFNDSVSERVIALNNLIIKGRAAMHRII